MNKSKMCGALLLAAIVSGCGNSNRTAKAPKPNTPQRIIFGNMGTYHVTHVLERAFYSDLPGRFMFSQDGKTIIAVGSGFEDKVLFGGITVPLIYLFDAQTGAEIKRFPFLKGATAKHYVADKLVLSPDGKFIALWGVGMSAPIAPSSLLVVDLNSGRVVGQLDDARWTTYAAAWTKSGELLVARTSLTAPRRSQMLVCSHDGKVIRKTVDLPKRGVAKIETTTSGAPRVLVVSAMKSKPSDEDTPFQFSICQWRNDDLSAPIVKFPVGDLYLDAAFGNNIVALCGFDPYRANPNKPALYALVDTRTKRIMWRKREPTR